LASAGERHPLPHPARQLVRIAGLEPAELHEVDQPPSGRLALGGRHLADLGPEDDVLGHGAPREQRVLLEHHAGELLRAAPLGKADLAARGLLQPRNDLEQRGFPATGGTEENQELAGHHVERDRLQRDDRFAGPRDGPHLAEVPQLE